MAAMSRERENFVSTRMTSAMKVILNNSIFILTIIKLLVMQDYKNTFYLFRS